MKNTKIILAVIIFIVIIIFLKTIPSRTTNADNFKDNFENIINTTNPITTNPFTSKEYESNRTLLYGSLFLDNLNEQIQRLTNPPIQYDNKRIELVKYSDIVL